MIAAGASCCHCPCLTLCCFHHKGPCPRENTVLQKTFGRILGCALLSYGSTALAFTLPPISQEDLTPSTIITDAFTLQAQVQLIAGTIRAQIFGLRRSGSSEQV